MRPMKRASGLLFIAASALSGMWAEHLMGLASIGGPSSWWYPTVLGAAIVLLVAGIKTLFPQFTNFWLAIAAAALSLLSWNVGAWAKQAIVFAICVAVIAWTVLAAASGPNRRWLAPLVPSAVLVLWWIPALVRSLYLSNKAVGLVEVISAVAPCVLALSSAVLSAAFLLLRRDRMSVR